MRNQDLYKLIEPHAPLAIRYFTFLFEKIPSTKIFKCKIDAEELKTYLRSAYSDFDLRFIQTERTSIDPESMHRPDMNGVTVILKDGLILQNEYTDIFLCYDERIPSEELDQLQEGLLKIDGKNKKNNRFFMIKKNPFNEYELVDFKIRDVEVNVETNYNDDLVAMHTDLLAFLDRKKENGMVLFHGLPGTGKTSYIRKLIQSTESRFIYIPNNLFPHLSDPEFLSFISSFPESIIILEDCEDLLRSRGSLTADTGLSNLLNLGDGLLGDALQLKIVCTFNCELSKVDDAMLRKGRLAFRYEFGPLAVTKADQLFQSLGIEHSATEPMTLADIFNFGHDNNSGKIKKGKIGF